MGLDLSGNGSSETMHDEGDDSTTQIEIEPASMRSLIKNSVLIKFHSKAININNSLHKSLAKANQHCQNTEGELLNITHTHLFNGPLSGTTQASRYQKGKTNLDFTRNSEWQWHQLGHMQVCTSLQTDNHASTPPLSFLQAGCPSCRPTNSVEALKAEYQ